MRGPRWSQEELDYLEEAWGNKTIPQIANYLGRSVNAIRVKTARLGYAGQTRSGEMMSAYGVANLLGVGINTILDRWIPKYGLPGKRRRTGTGRRPTTIIRFGDLLRWLEAHQDLWDSRKVELYGLGVEYDWLTAKRKADAKKPVRKRQGWTPEEDARLIGLYLRSGMTLSEMAKELHCSPGAVQHRLQRLLGRGKTEAYERYWQRLSCQLWSDTKGCTAGEKNCDECVSYRRVQPQYCEGCGATFYEREQNRLCASCRAGRKKRRTSR